MSLMRHMSSLFMTRNRNLGGSPSCTSNILGFGMFRQITTRNKKSQENSFLDWVPSPELGSSGWLVTDCNPCGHGGICIETILSYMQSLLNPQFRCQAPTLLLHFTTISHHEVYSMNLQDHIHFPFQLLGHPFDKIVILEVLKTEKTRFLELDIQLCHEQTPVVTFHYITVGCLIGNL